MSPESTNSAAAPLPASLPQPFVIQQRDSYLGRFGRYLLIGIVLCVMAMFGMAAQMQSYFSDPNGPQERYHSLSKTATNKVAVLQVTGAIIESDDFVKKQIDRIRADESVKAIVLRINSPGGTVTYSDYLLHHLNELKAERELPVVVSMGSICASGGYYLAMAVGDEENTIFAEPTTWTGSIGVIIPHWDFSGAMNKFPLFINDDSVASGDFKQMGSPTKPRSPEEQVLFEQLVEIAFQGFLDKVKAGRPKLAETPDKLAELTQGQIFTASQALEGGLVDEIGFVEAAVERALELANLDENSARCVTYKKPIKPLDALLGAKAPPSPASSSVTSPLRSLIELSTPRAYYLWSALPVLGSAQ